MAMLWRYILLLVLAVAAAVEEWTCPELALTSTPTSPGTDNSNQNDDAITCHCDMPHTLRCAGQARSVGDVSSIVSALRALPRQRQVSLLDLSVQNVTKLDDDLFASATPLHGLVVSSGEISGDISSRTFLGLAATLTALGLPNNRLTSIPSQALRHLVHLERLDLSNNRIRSITGRPFAGLDNLRFLDLSGNVIETLGPSSLASAPNLRILQLRSNLLQVTQLSESGVFSGLGKLQELDLSLNRFRGRLGNSLLFAGGQGLESLVTLQLSGNNFTLLKRGMLSGLKRLRTLGLARNQVNKSIHSSFSAFIYSFSR